MTLETILECIEESAAPLCGDWLKARLKIDYTPISMKLSDDLSKQLWNTLTGPVVIKSLETM